MSPSLASAPALIVADEVALGVAIAGGAVLSVLALGWWSSHRELTGRSRDPARHLLDALPEAVMEVDSTGRILVVNRSACALLGREADDLVGVDADTVLVDADQGVLADWLAMDVTSSDGGEIEHVALEARVERPDGAHVEVAITVHHGADDTLLLRWTDRARGVEEREALDQARHRFQQAFQSAPTGMALVRLDDGRIVDANQSLADMLERSVVDLVGRTLREFTHPDDVRQAQPHRARLELGLVDSYRLDQRFRRRDNSWVWARTRVSVSEDDGVLLAINHIEDVTEQRRTAEQLQHAARHDELTRLPNRAYLMSILEQRLAGAQPSAVGILFIDLDHFKVVNDSLGHVIGDELLQEVSRRLQTAVREGDVLARFGGDEFVVVLDGRGRAVDAAVAAERLRAAVHPPITIGDNELFVTASVGYSTNHDAGMTPGEMLRDADAAMYRAKARGRDCVEAFEAGGHEAKVADLRTAGELRRGIERGEIVPYFQPIVDLASGRTTGFEVLARWLHPDRGLLTPAHFLAFAEDSGLLVELGAAMLRSSLSQLAAWREEGLDFASGSISVNVGSRQLVDPSFPARVAEALQDSGIDADSLWFEITETALLTDARAATAALREVEQLGVHIAVDDFGTGYSSLTYLKRFPVEAIKIDRSFVAGLGIDDDDSTIVEAVVQLGRSLGVTVVAEGVESPLQLSRLRELNCDRGQGYLFGRPRPAEIIVREGVGG